MDEVLSDQELHFLTGYKRAKEQLRELAAMGIPARRLRDNSVRVLRMHLVTPASSIGLPKPRPKLKLT